MDLQTQTQPETHTQAAQTLGREGSADMVVPQSLLSRRCQGTYRSMEDTLCVWYVTAMINISEKTVNQKKKVSLPLFSKL